MTTIPSWLDHSLLSSALNGAKILTVEAKPAVSAGEHYLSTILQVNVVYEKDESTDEINLIFKSYPEGYLEEFVKDTQILVKEIIMYNEVLPLMSKFLGKDITPCSINSNRNDILILEDLKSNGFKMRDRIERLDLEHSSAAIKVLAEFHAASMIINEKHPDILQKAKKEVQFYEGLDFQKAFFTNGFKLLGEQLKSWPGLEKYATRLTEASDGIWNDVLYQIDSSNCDFLVLNHGDFWSNNIMFRYENGCVKEVKVIDLQFCRWTTPAIDLQLFFTTSIKNRKDVNTLIDIYLSRLNDLIQPNKLSIDQLRNDLSRTECYSLLVTVTLLPLCLVDPGNAISFSETTECEFGNASSPASIASKGSNFCQVFPQLLQHYIDIGLL